MIKLCQAEQCDRNVLSRGWCSKHYARWRKHGDPLHENLKFIRKPCSVNNCVRLHYCKSYCHYHYNKYFETSGLVCSVDGCSRQDKIIKGFCNTHYIRVKKNGHSELKQKSYTLRVNKDGYVEGHIPGHPLLATLNSGRSGQSLRYHRVVLYDALGDGPHPCTYCGTSLSWFDKTLIVNHIDENKCNNEPANLEPVCFNCNVLYSMLRRRDERRIENDWNGS